ACRPIPSLPASCGGRPSRSGGGCCPTNASSGAWAPCAWCARPQAASPCAGSGSGGEGERSGAARELGLGLLPVFHEPPDADVRQRVLQHLLVNLKGRGG